MRRLSGGMLLVAVMLGAATTAAWTDLLLSGRVGEIVADRIGISFGRDMPFGHPRSEHRTALTFPPGSEVAFSGAVSVPGWLEWREDCVAGLPPRAADLSADTAAGPARLSFSSL